MMTVPAAQPVPARDIKPIAVFFLRSFSASVSTFTTGDCTPIAALTRVVTAGSIRIALGVAGSPHSSNGCVSKFNAT